MLFGAQPLFLLRPKKKGAAADAPKVYLFKCLAGADLAKDLFDMLKPLTRKGDDTPLRKSALVEEYNKLREYVQSILGSTFDNAESILHEPTASSRTPRSASSSPSARLPSAPSRRSCRPSCRSAAWCP